MDPSAETGSGPGLQALTALDWIAVGLDGLLRPVSIGWRRTLVVAAFFVGCLGSLAYWVALYLPVVALADAIQA